MKIDKYIVNNDVLNFTRCDQIYFNFKDKRIFSVLGSGNQVFHLINRGARKIFLFDCNNIAEWLSSSDYNNIWQFCRNVDQLLKDYGIAICSKLWNDDNDKRVKDILKRLFSINNLNDSTNYFPGYYLVKK